MGKKSRCGVRYVCGASQGTVGSPAGRRWVRASPSVVETRPQWRAMRRLAGSESLAQRTGQSLHYIIPCRLAVRATWLELRVTKRRASPLSDTAEGAEPRAFERSGSTRRRVEPPPFCSLLRRRDATQS